MLNVRRVSLLSVLSLGFIACCAGFGSGQLAASGFQGARGAFAGHGLGHNSRRSSSRTKAPRGISAS